MKLVLQAQGEFSWSTQEQGYVLGAGFLGFCTATLPTSKLAKIFQARRMVLYGSILTSLATFISPLAARWHVNLMIGAMFVRGLGQGDAKGACNSAFNFTVGHPKNELTTAKENQNVASKPIKQKL
ncbi:inorganic phosphate cotransporter [Trichonephila clavipes]|nr:inorganic phosphate cotransporter [Trichonephila clavipes]